MTGREAKAQFRGCYVATLTPLDSTGEVVDRGVVRDHVRWLVERGVEGLCPVGTTGEFLYLSEAEKGAVMAATVEAVAGRVPVIAGVWGLRSAEIERLAKVAEDAGADAVFLQTPIYYPADDATMVAHYRTAARATRLPVFAYSIPQYAANTLSVAALEALFAEGSIVGVKDSSGKSERVGELIARFGAQGVVFAASDSFAVEGRRLGADGFISAIANVVPALFARLWGGEVALQSEVDRLRNALKQVGSIPALKYLLTRQGFPFGPSRLPGSDLTPEHRSLLDSLLPTTTEVTYPRFGAIG